MNTTIAVLMGADACSPDKEKNRYRQCDATEAQESESAAQTPLSFSPDLGKIRAERPIYVTPVVVGSQSADGSRVVRIRKGGREGGREKKNKKRPEKGEDPWNDGAAASRST